MFDVLESRCLLSTVLNNGVLHVHGTPNADHIHLNLKEDGLLHVVVNDKLETFDPADVTDIIVDGDDGDDLIEVVKTHVVANIRGGNGNDTIRVFTNSKIDGGDGLDTVEVATTDVLQSVLNVEQITLVSPSLL